MSALLLVFIKVGVKLCGAKRCVERIIRWRVGMKLIIYIPSYCSAAVLSGVRKLFSGRLVLGKETVEEWQQACRNWWGGGGQFQSNKIE
jgi:hypothetical protein